MAPQMQVMALLLPLLAKSIGARADAEVDWLVATPRTTSTVTETASTLTLSNGLTSRVFALTPVRALMHEAGWGHAGRELSATDVHAGIRYDRLGA